MNSPQPSVCAVFNAVARGEMTAEEGARVLSEVERGGVLVSLSPLTAWRLIRKAWAWVAKR